MWFSTNGYGAFKFDGEKFTNISTQNGLIDDSVDVILEDSKENIWLGTRFGGVSRYDGDTIKNFVVEGFTTYEVCCVYEDSSENIWFSAEGYGIYRYDGETLKNFNHKHGLGIRAPQTICLLYTSPSPRDRQKSRMPSSA